MRLFGAWSRKLRNFRNNCDKWKQRSRSGHFSSDHQWSWPMSPPPPVPTGERTASALPRDLPASVSESAVSGERRALPPRGAQEPACDNKKCVPCGMPLDAGRIWPIVGAWPAHWRARVVHPEGTYTIGHSTATPRRRPAFDREGPSTVFLALRSASVTVPVSLQLATDHSEAAAGHPFSVGNWPL